MKHILLCTTSFPDDAFVEGQEAAGSFVADFANVLSQYAQVSIVAPSLKKDVKRFPHLSIYRFQVPSLPLSLLKPQNPTHWFKIIQTLQAGQQMMWQVVNEYHFDHILALWALPSGYWARTISKKMKIPFSIWALGSDIWGLGKVPIIRSFLKQVLQDGQIRFADGYQLALETERIGKRPCLFLPSTRKLKIDTDKEMSQEPPYKLAFLGRWHSNKGADILLNALHMLHDEDWNSIDSIQYCGGGPLEATVYRQIESLTQLKRPITLSGYLNQKEATKLYLWADYLMIPSRIESIPVIFSDAMQTNCPIITMPVGDLPRLIREFQVGVQAEEVTAAGFAKAIREAIHQSPSQYVLGIEKARQIFDIDQSVRTFLSYCEV